MMTWAGQYTNIADVLNRF